MTRLLEQAISDLQKLPEEEQDTIAEYIISFLHPDPEAEAEWDALLQSPESQRTLDLMVDELKAEEEQEGLLPFPGEK